MPADDLHPGVSPTTFQFTSPEVRAAIVAMDEMLAVLEAVMDYAADRDNHTGTQTAATISNFATAVRAVTASETAVGVSERATTAEVQTMTDTTRYISPAGLAAASVSAATANRIVRRDANGRAQVANPSVAADIATKGYVDGSTVNYGTTAQRDAYYGAYTTVAQQVAIANMVPMWFNTTTRRFETFYAINGSSGLVVPGLHTTGFAAGWYPVTSAGNWAGKSGTTATNLAFRNTWARSVDSGGVIKSTHSTQEILIGLDGVYEIQGFHRGPADGSSYSTLARAGVRNDFEKLSGAIDATPISGIWTHGHSGGNNAFAVSYWLGPLPAGFILTFGPQADSNTMTNSAAASNAGLMIKKID